MDFYLNENNITERLIEEWKKYGEIVIAFDFDNTVYDYHKKGHSYNQVINLLRECKELGAHLILFTARRDDEMEFVEGYLKGKNIPYDSINKDPAFVKTPGKKVYYNILLDDRAGLPSAYNSLKNAAKVIRGYKNEAN